MTADIQSRPWHVGLRAAKANALPGGIVQLMMLILALLYYFYPPMQNILNDLAAFRDRTGFAFSACITIIGGALLPEALGIACFQKFRITRKNVIDILLLVPFWAFTGAWIDLFYRFQGVLFGNTASVGTVICKVVVDQFVYSPLIGVPMCLFYYQFKDQRGRLKGVLNYFSLKHYAQRTFPALIACWGVWIPLTSIMYALPKNLQIPLFGLANSLWVLLLMFMTRKHHDVPAAEPVAV